MALHASPFQIASPFFKEPCLLASSLACTPPTVTIRSFIFFFLASTGPRDGASSDGGESPICRLALEMFKAEAAGRRQLDLLRYVPTLGGDNSRYCSHVSELMAIARAYEDTSGMPCWFAATWRWLIATRCALICFPHPPPLLRCHQRCVWKSLQEVNGVIKFSRNM